jgi:hypothetical protein
VPPPGDEFGDAPLLELLDRHRSTADAFCQTVVDAVTAFARGPLADELTLLASPPTLGRTATISGRIDSPR